jgi:hypothetical protein
MDERHEKGQCARRLLLPPTYAARARCAPPSGSSCDRCSPALAQLNRDAFVLHEALESTVRLEEHRGDSDLTDLNLGEENATVG